MTQVDFYTHVEDKLATACKLCAKALAAKVRMLVCTPDAQTSERFSRMLWSVPQTSFIPHCSASDRLAAVTPVIIDHGACAPPHQEVLLNLRDELPPAYERFQRVIEIVSTDEDDAQAARERFRHYRAQGFPIQAHELGGARADT